MRLHDILAQIRRAARLLHPAAPQGRKKEDKKPHGLLQRLKRWGLVPRAGGDAAVEQAPVEPVAEHLVPRAKPRTEPPAQAPGRFLPGVCSNQAGTRAYKLYVPAGYNGDPLPLIVMLHGCNQNPDDFATGTGMNGAADLHKFFVVYPAQSRNANGSHCWNWFSAPHQRRDGGEPAIIADITREVMREFHVDPNRVYVAGLSAGGAMAAILADAYPDLYAAVGIHSGLPAGAAHNATSAFAAMKRAGRAAPTPPYRQAVPAIVFHGDRDRTVHPDNGAGALTQTMGRRDGTASEFRVVQGSQQGRGYTQTIYFGDGGAALAEHWVVHGADHAWSGGSSHGSYADPMGPDATQEMVRFFLAHPKRGAT